MIPADEVTPVNHGGSMPIASALGDLDHDDCRLAESTVTATLSGNYNLASYMVVAKSLHKAALLSAYSDPELLPAAAHCGEEAPPVRSHSPSQALTCTFLV